MRRGLCKDLGFTAAERSENLRRSAEVAKLINNAGLICICAFVAPNEDVRQKVGANIGEDRFFVVHLNAPIEVCRERDEEGFYDRADSGEITDFPGVSSPYDVPESPALVIDTSEHSVSECVDQIVQMLEDNDVLS